MNSITTQAIITGVRSKADRSLGLSVSTPELSIPEKAIFMELQGLNVDLKITPRDIEEEPEEYKIDKDLEQKTQSQRIRSVLFLLWKKNDEGMADFEMYYKNKTEIYIEHLKRQIDE